MHKSKRCGARAVCIWLVGLGVIMGQGCSAPVPQMEFQFAEQRARLGSNGLRVVVLPDDTTELVEVDVRYQVGSSSDPLGKAGLAHFVEHLNFLQRPDGERGAPLMHYIQRTTTFFNAFTNWDTTHYMAMGRKENLENLLQIEAMRLFYGCQTISETEFEREREVVRNEIRQRSGTDGAHESDRQSGLAAVTARMLRPPGYGGVERGFVSAQGFARGDYSGIDAEVVDIYLDALLEELERRVKAGRYSQEDIERWQKQRRYQLQSQRFRERLAFVSELNKAVYGAEHPYATGGMSTAEALGDIGRDAAVKFRNKHYSADNAVLVLAGNLDVVAAEALVRKHFGGWGRGHRDAPVSAPAAQRDAPAYIGVVTGKRPQMSVAIAYPGPAGYDAGHATRLILREMLNVRMADVRQELGASYGVYARWNPRQGPSMYTMGGDVDAQRAGVSLAAMRTGVEAVRSGYDGFDADFAHARRLVVQKLLGQSTVSANVASRLDTIARFGLPPDHDAKLLRQVAATRPIQVQALAQKELNPAREVVVCSADRETLVQAFAAAGVANPQLVEPK